MKQELQTQQSQTKKEVKDMRELNIEFISLYEHTPIPVPWKFVVEWEDYFWPVRWFLYPIGEGDFWLVKKESPWNKYVREILEIVGIFIDGELEFVEPKWNNEILQVWSRENVLHLFEKVRRGEYSGVMLVENCDEEERKEAERLIILQRLIRRLLNEEGISEYGKITFWAHVEWYYSKQLEEFRDFFEKLAELKGEERIKYLKNMKRNLNQRLFETGYFMHVYYP